MQQSEKTSLVKVGGTIYLRVPTRFHRENNLGPGDSIYWITEKNGARLRLINPEVTKQISALEAQAEAEAMAAE